MHKHLPRLTTTWSSNAIFFITTCTYHRPPILANEINAGILRDEWRLASERYGWIVGRYVIMPDHVHFFCSFAAKEFSTSKNELSTFMQHWKQWTSKRMIKASRDNIVVLASPIWQKEFFDHVLRSEESYIQKWEYVYENLVRKKLVNKAEEWPWQGEIYDLTVSEIE